MKLIVTFTELATVGTVDALLGLLTQHPQVIADIELEGSDWESISYDDEPLPAMPDHLVRSTAAAPDPDPEPATEPQAPQVPPDPLDVPCPGCGAAVDEYCHTAMGSPYSTAYYHLARRQAVGAA